MKTRRHELGHGDSHQLRTIGVVDLRHPSAHAHVVARAKAALRCDRPRAADVIQQREVKDVREIRRRQAREASQLYGKQRVSKRALRRHVMREVGGERNRRQQLSQTKASLSGAGVRF